MWHCFCCCGVGLTGVETVSIFDVCAWGVKGSEGCNVGGGG